MTDDILLEVTKLTKTFGEFNAVDAFSVEVRRGEILALLGPSGCGKTTTLRMIAGLERPTLGRIRYRDTVFVSVDDAVFVPASRRNVGMVFQSYALWPHMTVFKNVAYPLRIRRIGRAETRERVHRVLDLFGLGEFADRAAHQLSGGQQQRVALARALVYEPSLVLFDEPFSNLDARLRSQMRVELKSLQKRLHLTGIFVTHDQLEALSLADRVAIMSDGRIEQIGAPSAVYDHPATRFVRDFLGKIVTFRGWVRALNGDGRVAVALPGPSGEICVHALSQGRRLSVNEAAEVAVRPEDVRIAREAAGPPGCGVNRLAGRIEDILFTGDSQECRIRVGDDVVLLELPRDGARREGQEIAIAFGEEHATAWPAEG